jgi:hypothetical protein
MSDLESFNTAVVQALAPALRDALHGRDVDEEEVKAELEYQLGGRGFTVVQDE